MKNVFKTEDCLKFSRFGTSREWKNKEPISVGASKAHIKKSLVKKMRLKKSEKDSVEWESRIHEIGSGLNFWSCERGHVLSCALGEYDIISWRSWRIIGKNGWPEER